MLTCSHLDVPDSPSDLPCSSAFLRIDLGDTSQPARRWAVWSVPRSERADDAIAVQASASSRGATVAAAWACAPGAPLREHPARLLLDQAAPLLDGLLAPDRPPPLIARDPIWAAREWADRWSPLGRDHAHLGLGVLATGILAWPIWKAMDAPDAAIAWLASVGFTGVGLLAAARIHRSVALPSPRASELFSRIKGSALFEHVEEPRVAEAMPLPVAATLRKRRVLDQASISNTLVMARRHRRTGQDLRLALRSVSWPQATDLQGRVLPRAWLSLELSVPGGATSDSPVLARAERDGGAMRVVLDADEADSWDGRI